MSNHEHRCRGCGDDLRKLGNAHETDCLARKLDAERAASAKDLEAVKAASWDKQAELRREIESLESRLGIAASRIREAQSMLGPAGSIYQILGEALKLCAVEKQEIK